MPGHCILATAGALASLASKLTEMFQDHALGTLFQRAAEEPGATALLESALHEANGHNPRIYRAQLAQYGLMRVRFAPEVRLIDLRDEALAALAMDPAQLTDALPLHYAFCYR